MPVVLVAALDWGLGHATRSIPVIRAFCHAGAGVVLAAEGPVAHLWKEAFPALEILPLKGYKITYARNRLLWHLVRQLPKLRNAISNERRWLAGVVKDRHIDIVVSDNRYGLCNAAVFCVLITHQLKPALPGPLRWAEPLLQSQLYSYINRFNQVWVPDALNRTSALSGKLGHPHRLPSARVRYIGWLSRFGTSTSPVQERILIVLSGPEPQRTMLEELLIPQLPLAGCSTVLVRGLPKAATAPSLPGIEVYNHLSAAEMESQFARAEFVISRGGYSTLMDAFTMGKKCIVIPTPGQTEQEYLAQTLGEKGVVLVESQHTLTLETVLNRARLYNWQPVQRPGLALEAFVTEVMHKVNPPSG